MKRVTQLLMLLCLLVMGQAAWAQTGGTVTYIYADPQGTPLAETDAQGNVTKVFDYTPYGSTALGTPPNGPGYTGHVNDPETNLVYMQARYYDSATGHFLSVDPVAPKPGDAYGFNRYDYVNNSPINHIDANGREAACVSMAGHCGGVADHMMSIDDMIEVGRELYEPMGAEFPVLEPAEELMAAVTAGAEAVKVRAEAQIGDKVFVDVNQGARASADATKETLIADRVSAKAIKNGRDMPNGNMATAHAEIGAMQQAFDAGATQGAEMTMTVWGRVVCQYCAGDIPAMADAAGLTKLTIYENKSGSTLLWQPGVKSLQEVKTQ
jgi:RHS repeat-associated protein